MTVRYRTYAGIALSESRRRERTCGDCGTVGNVSRDTDGVQRCHGCSYAAWWERTYGGRRR